MNTKTKAQRNHESTRGTLVHRGGKLVIVGDTHFSEIYSGSHRDYFAESIALMESIYSKVDDSVTGLILLGDIFGVREQRLRSLLFRSNLLTFFRRLQERLEKNNKTLGFGAENAFIACVKGNHDHSGVDNITEFEFFLEQNMFHNPRYVDVLNSEGLKTRLHFVNYGDERRELDVVEDEGVSNVVLGHGEYVIKDVTNWFHTGENAVNISDMENLWGIDLIISGHIHTPSQQFDTAVMANHEVIKLFYPGAPCRVAERVDDVFYVVMTVGAGGEVDVEVREFGLPPADEVFLPKELLVGEEMELGVGTEEFAERNKRLKEILDELVSSRLSSGNLLEQDRKSVV